MDFGPLVAIGIALASGIVNWIRQSSSEESSRAVAAALIEEKVASLKTGDRELAADLKDAARSLQNVATQIQVLNAEQAVINRLNTQTLQGLVAKVEIHDEATCRARDLHWHDS